MKILFVCLGNICRSPLGEAILKHKIAKLGLEAQHVIHSCGTSNYHIGEQPDARTIRNAKKNGVEMDHLGRQLTSKDLQEYDLILAMDKSNYNNIMLLKDASLYADKIKMMREFDSQGPGKDVPDPWSGDEKGFQEVFEILDRATDGLIKSMVKK